MEFSWRKIEPYPEQFDINYINDCVAFLDLARKYDIQCVVQPAFHYTPDWLPEKYPDLYLKTPDGARGEGAYLEFCPDKKDFRREIKPALELLVSALKDHPQLLAWSPWNEPGLSGEVCYCEDTLERFGGRAPTSPEPGEDWLAWMRFRQENFLDFFQWMKEVITGIDHDHPITIKTVWCPIDSTVAWSHGTRYDYWAKVAGIMGHDPYPHPQDFFINRWIADWMRSAAPQKPAWFLEFNRAFARERGLPSPGEIRSWTYQSMAHGISGFLYFFYPMNPFEPHIADNQLALSFCDKLEPTDALEEIYRIAGEMRKLKPMLENFHVPEPEIAVLHSWSTQFQMAGEKYPTANETAPAQILYRHGYRVTYMSEEDLLSGRMKNYKILFVTGTVAISENVLEAIKRFHDRGGHIFACARFAERDEKARPYQGAPPSWFGVNVMERNTYARPEIEAPEFVSRAQFNDRTSKVYRQDRSRFGTSFPMKWESPLFDFFYDQGFLYKGDEFSAGTFIGFEDMKVEEEVIERIITEKNAKVLASFAPLRPGIVTTPQTVYVARDLSWCDENMERFIVASVKRAGVKRYAWATDPEGRSLPQIDVGVLEDNKTRRLIIISCSDKLYEWDGTPEPVEVHIKSKSDFTDVLQGETFSNKLKKEQTVIKKKLAPGEVLILLEGPQERDEGHLKR